MKSHVRALIEAEPETWLTTLEEKYKVHVTRDGDLVSLKYNQIESPMYEPLVQECRGMVVCTRRKQILAWGYDKFWNAGEHLAAQIDWSTARVQDKVDGSLIQMYWDDEFYSRLLPDELDLNRHGWRVSSSGHPTAGGRVGKEDQTFADLFWQTWDASDMALPPERFRGATFCFELCTPANRIIVRHQQPYIVLHGARGSDCYEIQLSTLGVDPDLRNWRTVREYPLTSLAECMAAAEAMDPLHQEGFVVVDAAFNRIKIKSPRYVALHHLKGDIMTTRRAIELWQTGECGELLANFPELEPDITPVHDKLDAIANLAVADYTVNMNAPTRKDFALAVKDLPHSAILFKMATAVKTDDLGGDWTAGARAIMRAMTTQALERLLDSVVEAG